ncbi:hypothetical protein SAMN04515671_0081 [Nakamurella panacisegetis]|uniref:Uncharacterized protein n=1 Tax=Nakamurella panacisegetis TaxID=1090615 RepID=A0A1H0HHZ6_9ACTN|nr:hypothetical protein [Nakamurella panacisegetis]SDO18815.1 hypothetical protein SAMN04515671_0081 [Nakamurella panacisegetis]
MNLDPRLVALAEAVERGAVVAPIGILTGAGLVQGTPVTYAAFYEASTISIGRQLARAMPSRELKSYDGREADLWAHLRGRINPAMSALGDPSQPDTLALNIAPAQCTLGTTVLHVPAVRVPLSAVDTWWVSDFIPEQKTPMFVGFTVGL